MRGATGEALEASAGGGAPLFELAALVSAPGARAQPMHADTLWCEGGCLFTAFVALQPVRCEMGPAHLSTRPLSTDDPTHTHSRILRPNHSRSLRYSRTYEGARWARRASCADRTPLWSSAHSAARRGEAATSYAHGRAPRHARCSTQARRRPPPLVSSLACACACARRRVATIFNTRVTPQVRPCSTMLACCMAAEPTSVARRPRRGRGQRWARGLPWPLRQLACASSSTLPSSAKVGSGSRRSSSTIAARRKCGEQ